MLSIVGQILVQVRQAVGVLAQAVVDGTVVVAGGQATEAVQVNDEQRTDVVRLATQVLLPLSPVIKSR